MKAQTDLVTDVFDRKAPTYFDGYHGDSTTAHSFVIRRQRIYEMLEPRRSGRLLDIGCGPGVTVEDLVARGFEFYGVDIAQKMIDECRTRFGHLPAAHFSTGRIEQLDFAPGFFGAVVASGVVEYVDDDGAAIAEMARVLEPGGVAIISLPNYYSPYRIWQRTVYASLRSIGRRLRGRPAPEGEIDHREYAEGAYRRLLAVHGLVTNDVVYYNFKILLFPLDRLFPKATVFLSRALERFGRGPMRWLGTGLLVRAEKR